MKEPMVAKAQAAVVDMRGEEARRAAAAAEARLERFAVAALQGVLSADVSEPHLKPEQVAEYAMKCAVAMQAQWCAKGKD